MRGVTKFYLTIDSYGKILMPQCAKQVNWKKQSWIPSRRTEPAHPSTMCSTPCTFNKFSPVLSSPVKSRLSNRINGICKDGIHFLVNKYFCPQKNFKSLPFPKFSSTLSEQFTPKTIMWAEQGRCPHQRWLSVRCQSLSRVRKMSLRGGDLTRGIRSWARKENVHGKRWPGQYDVKSEWMRKASTEGKHPGMWSQNLSGLEKAFMLKGSHDQDVETQWVWKVPHGGTAQHRYQRPRGWGACPSTRDPRVGWGARAGMRRLCGVRGDLPSIMGNQRASRASTGQWESRGMSNHCNPRKAR